MRTVKIFFPILFACIIIFTLVSGLALASSIPAATNDSIIYVDAAAAGAATGLSWTDAFTTVQESAAHRQQR